MHVREVEANMVAPLTLVTGAEEGPIIVDRRAGHQWYFTWSGRKQQQYWKMPHLNLRVVRTLMGLSKHINLCLE